MKNRALGEKSGRSSNTTTPTSAPFFQSSQATYLEDLPNSRFFSAKEIRDFRTMATLFDVPLVADNNTSTKRMYSLRRVFSSDNIPVKMDWKIQHRSAANPKNCLVVTFTQDGLKPKMFPDEYQETIAVLCKISPAAKAQTRTITVRSYYPLALAARISLNCTFSQVELQDDDIVIKGYYRHEVRDDVFIWEFQIAETEPMPQPVAPK